MKNAKIFVLVLFALGTATIFLTGEGSSRATSPSPEESYVQEPVRNMKLCTQVEWTFEYQPADSNAADVWAQETAPNMLIEELELNSAQEKDGNRFVLCTPEVRGVRNLNIFVSQYCNGQSGEYYSTSLRAQWYAFGSIKPVSTIRTGSFHNDSDAVADLAQRLYSWLHKGWHID
jgi:hypothetical protein